MTNENEQRSLAIPEKTQREGFVFGASQQKAISDLAISYLRHNNIDFNKDTLKAAFGVLRVDSLARGLAAAGRDTLKPTESIRPLIRRGLEERKKIKETTAEIYQEFKDELMTTESAYIGPFALPKGVFLGSERELQRFAITPDLSNSEKIAYLYQSRTEMLPKIAELAISTLSKEEYPEASIDNFPEVSQQAKIVRNMIASIIFRGNPSPVISIEELSQFSNREDIQAMFTEELTLELSKSIASRVGLPEENIGDYVTGLYTQVKEAFIKHEEFGLPRLIHEEEDAKHDQLYRAFDNTLLLLHPALEEQPLITSLLRLQDRKTDYSIWSKDFSTLIGTARIPILDGLYRAIRLVEAEGFSPERFTQGVSAWVSFKRGQEREARQINTLASQIITLEQELERIQKIEEQLPNSAEWLMRTFRHEEWTSYADTRGTLRKNQQIIDQAKELRNKTFVYLDSIKNENNGELPQEAPALEWILEEQRIYEAGRPRRILASVHGRIERAVETLQQDFLTQNNREFEEEIDSIEGRPIDEIKTLIEKTQGEIDRVGKESPKTILVSENIDASQVLEFIDVKLEFYEDDPRSRSPLGRKAVELKNLRNLIRRRQNSGFYKERDGVPSEFYLFSLTIRKNALETLLNAKTKIENVPEVEEVSSVWSKSEFEEWARQIEISTLPEETPTTFIEQHIGELNNWWRKFNSRMAFGIRWPKSIPPREAFIKWVYETIDARRARIGKGPSPRQEIMWRRTRQNLENNIVSLSELITILDNPLFPLKEGEGLQARNFWNLFGKRIQIANAIVNQNPLRETEETTTESFMLKKREIYREYLKIRKQRFEKELSDLQSNQPAMTKFVEQMRGLDLTLEES